MNIFKFLEKQKGVILAVAAILTVAFAALCFYKLYVDDNNQTPIDSYTFGGITSIDDTIELSEGQTLVQEYYCVNFNYGQIGFVAQATTEEAKLEVVISDGETTQTMTFTQQKLLSGYTYSDLDDELKKSTKEQLIVTFTAKEGDFLLSANKTVPVDGSSCTLDGEARQTNVVIDVRTLSDTSGNTKYIVISVVTVLFLIAVFCAIKFKWLSIAGLTAVVLAFLCAVCAFVFAPFTVPDEGAHYRSVYHVSNMIMFDFKDEQSALRMRECDYEFFKDGKISLYSQSYIKENGYDKFFADNTQVVTTDRGYMTNKFIPHFAGGLGLTLARLIGMGPYWAFMLARAFNVAQCILLVYFAIKIIPFGKIALSAISLIPINLHIMASCSYDAFSFGGVALLFAYILYLAYDKNKIGWKQLLLLAIIIAAVVPQKVVYIGVAALLLIIPKESFAKPKWHLVFKCALGVIAVASILILQMSHSEKMVSDTVTNSTAAGFSIGYVLQNPLHIAKMLIKTIIIQGDFYSKSMISYFGWFEFETPWFMALPFVAILCLAFMKKENEPPALGFAQRGYSLVLFMIVFVFIELLLLLDHTGMSSEIVLGVQGRYFIPALPLLFVFLRNNTIELKRNVDAKLLFLMTVLNSGMFIFCCSKIV